MNLVGYIERVRVHLFYSSLYARHVGKESTLNKTDTSLGVRVSEFTVQNCVVEHRHVDGKL